MTEASGTFGSPNPGERRRRGTVQLDDAISGEKSLPPAPPLKDLDPLNVCGLLLAERYRVVRFVGSGGLGFVYAGVDLRFLRPGDNAATVAIKFMKHARMMMKDFHREAQLMKQFGQSHHAFVEVYDYGVSKEGLPWLVMEFLPDAISVNELMARYQYRVPTDIVVQFLREVCPALSLAHSRNLVHRDLSGSNIMLARAGDPRGRTFKILDFGLSTQLNATDDLANQTITSNPYGTPSHMAPEQVTSQGTTPQTDVYSIGVTLFQLLTGKLPLPRTENLVEALDHCRHTVPFTFREVAPERKFRPEVERVVQQCLCKRPSDRPKDLQQVAEQLLAALTVTESPPAAPNRLGWIAAAAICGIGLVAAWRPWLQPTPVPAVTPSPVTPPPVTPPSVRLEPEELTVTTGGEAFASIQAEHLEPDSRVTLQADAETELTVEIDQDSNVLEGQQGRLVVRADRSAPPRRHTIKLTATALDSEGKSHVIPLEMTVRVVWLPQGFQPISESGEVLLPGHDDPAVNAAIEQDSDHRYGFRRIRRQIGSEQVDFLLVSRPAGGNDLSSFYIMEFKAWRGLYKAYLKASSPPPLEERELALQAWANEGTDRWPATGLSPLEADQFVKWLGGKLPTQAQWDRAAGYEFSLARAAANLPARWSPSIWNEGPYRTPAQGRPRIALREHADVGTSEHDETWCGCRDMAGNGYEFLDDMFNTGTRLSRRDPAAVFDPLTDRIKLRGQPIYGEKISDENAAPLRFQGLSEHVPTQPIDEWDPASGFRAVIER